MISTDLNWSQLISTEQNYLKNFFGYLKLNIVGDKIVNFLDLKITLNEITNKLNFNLHLTLEYLILNTNELIGFLNSIYQINHLYQFYDS